MKTRFSIFFWLLAMGLLSCSKDGGEAPEQQAANATSEICQNVTGIEAIYWDLSNGVLRGDIPGGIPTVKNPGDYYIHSGYPALGFQMPAGYQAFEISDASSQAIGVDVVRNDNKVVWRYLTFTSAGIVQPQQILNQQVNIFVDALGNANDAQAICENSFSQPITSSMINSGASVMLRSGTSTLVVKASSLMSQDLNTSFISIEVSAGPTAEFAMLALDTYLAITWQLLYIDNDIRDTDLDGTPDVNDNFPYDPTKQ